MLKKIVSTVLVISMIFSILAAFTITAAAADITVDIVSFRRGAQADLRSSELLEARVEGYSGNVRELTYEWTNELGTYVYVYNSHNMYGINNTSGEIEIYNSSVESSENMGEYTYENSFSGVGYAWAAVYGANLANTALDGKLTVKVYDPEGNLLATDTHVGEVTQSGFWFWTTYEYSGFVPSDLKEDLSNIAFGLFENDTKKLKDVLGESSILHITCVECDVPSCSVVSGNQYIKVETDSSGNDYITGLQKGEGEVSIQLEKSNCKFHQNVTVTANITAHVYTKPIVTSNTTSITLTNLDDRCTYYIDGYKGVRDDEKGTLVFEGLSPNTTYEIEVAGQVEGTEPVYAYLYETTKPVHSAVVEIYLNGGENSDGTMYGTLVDIDTVLGENAGIYLRLENTDTYYKLEKTDTGVYSSALADGTYYIYYADNDSAKICDQQFTILGAGRTRELFFYSVTYQPNGGEYSGNTLEYHHDDGRVYVSSEAPVREGYDFTGWLDQDGNLHHPGGVLSEALYQPYTLTAQWEETKYAKVNLTLVIDHSDVNQEDNSGVDPDPGNGTVEIDLAYRLNDSEPYVEVVGQTKTYSNWYESGEKEGNVTTVKYEDIFKQLPINHEYSSIVFLDDYYVSESTVTQTFDADGNCTYDVTVYLNYNPDLFKLHYNIVADDSVPSDLIPQAVDIKVMAWNTNEDNAWSPITRHKDYSADVQFEGRTGIGSYGVPVFEDKSTDKKYYYRVAVAGFTLADGTEVTAGGSDGINYYSDIDAASNYANGAFYAVVEVTDGAKVDDSMTLDGSYGIYATDSYTQQGTITVTVYVNRYDVMFNSNGGSDIATIENQFTIPDVSGFVPTKTGYTFAGWYTDENCTSGNEVVSKTPITADVTLYAKWIENKTVAGTAAIADFYYFEEERHDINEADRPKSVKVLLQKHDPNGYHITLESQDVSVTYNDDHYGVGQFEFTDLPNDGSIYRIYVLSSSYQTLYQNAYSKSAVTDYESYDSSSFRAIFDTDNNGVEDTTTATVNTYLEFAPSTFDLQYQIDTSAIKAGHRPTSVETLILYDDGISGIYPQLWPPISHMDNNGVYIGHDTELTDTITLEKYPVWHTKPDSESFYNYSIRIQSVTLNGAEVTDLASLPFGIYYNGSARYSEVTGQSQMLTATLVPKAYTITYDCGNSEEIIITNMDAYESMDGKTYVDSYYWSYGKLLSAMPEREGYKFTGWYDASGNKVTEITSDMAENITLYAGWLETATFEVLADAGYYSQERNSADKVGVISLNAFIKNLETVKDYVESFGIYVYNDSTSELKATADSSDRSVLIKDEGHFHTIVSNISTANFDKKVCGVPFVVLNIDGENSVVMGDPFTTSVSEINKWLGPDNKYAQ